MADMRYVKLGGSGLTVSRVCLGGMGFGVPTAPRSWTVGYDETRAVIAAATDAGINFIDTANCYADGTSEEFIGRALRELGIPRDRVVLASKVFYNEGGLSRAAIMREIEGTLRRLRTDYLDLYVIHRFDAATPVEETLEARDELVRAGTVRAIGASAMYAYQLHTMQDVALANGWTPFSTMQSQYNLLYREDEHEMIPVCRQFGMALTPYSSLAAGRLARPTWDAPTRRSETDVISQKKFDPMREQDEKVVARVAELAEGHGVPMAAVAVAWLWSRGVESPIVGCSRPGLVGDVARALDVELTEDERAYLEEPYVPHPLVGVRPHELADLLPREVS